MADHRHVGLAVLDAVRDAANPWIFPELLDEGLEPWSSVELVAYNGSPFPTHALDVTRFIDRGVASLKEHRLYLEHTGTDADTMLRAWAGETGRAFGVDYAISFEVVHP
jgi:LmbE family N-acetylglucosaminyl deacetylase